MNFFKTQILWISAGVCVIALLAGSAYHFRRVIFPPPVPPPVRVTFIEGITVQKAATQIASAFSTISIAEFISAGQPYEGYLFPDTYFFSLTADAETIVKTM